MENIKVINIHRGFLLILLSLLIFSFSLLFHLAYWLTIIIVVNLICVQSALVVAWIRTEGQLQQSEARFRRIMANLPVAISCSDKDNNVIFNNNKYMDNIGYSIEETPTVHAWFEKSYPDKEVRKKKLNLWFSDLNNYKNHRYYKPLDITERITCRDGKTKDFNLNLFRDDEYSYAVFNDMTDFLRAEKALRDSREILLVATEMAQLGPWKLDLKTGLYEFNDQFYALYGTDVAREGKFMDRDMYVREFMHPEDVWMLYEAVRSNSFLSKERRKPGSYEHRIIRRDGVVRTIIVRANAISDETGKIVAVYGASQDITEQKQAEKTLRASRETLSVAAEMAKLGPWEFDMKTELFEFTDEFYAIYGTNMAREGKFMTPDVYVREFVHPEDTGKLMFEKDGYDKASSPTERVQSRHFEHRILRRDGAVRTIIVRANLIYDANGKMVAQYGANQDITEQKQVEEALLKNAEEIQRMAYTDSLTGLPNRMYLTERLKREIEDARWGGSLGAVLFIDLDGLKIVNDAYGHSYGDALIVIAGNRIVEQVGSTACVGRLGDDEYVVILPGESNRQRIGRIVGGIITALSQDMEARGVRFHISASAGVAVYPNDGETVEEIFRNADNAMFAAKKTSYNSWRFYETSMQAEAYEMVLLTNSLHHAIERGELLLNYQPKVSVQSGVVVGFEALLRWHSPEHGSISPVQFIPLAERSGLIHTIGEWVLREACRFTRRLVDQGWSHIHVAVNVSPYQLCSDRFINSVRDVLSEFGLDPCVLELEITESVLIASLAESTRRLCELRAMGVRLSLDDFGTGYSSLTYLQHLPVNTLKLDKSFIDMISVEGSHEAIIGTVVNMAHLMEMTVVAEGVETQEQFDFLARNDCDCVQGYLFSRPVPEDEAVRFLTILPIR